MNAWKTKAGEQLHPNNSFQSPPFLNPEQSAFNQKVTFGWLIFIEPFIFYLNVTLQFFFFFWGLKTCYRLTYTVVVVWSEPHDEIWMWHSGVYVFIRRCMPSTGHSEKSPYTISFSPPGNRFFCCCFVLFFKYTRMHQIRNGCHWLEYMYIMIICWLLEIRFGISEVDGGRWPPTSRFDEEAPAGKQTPMSTRTDRRNRAGCERASAAVSEAPWPSARSARWTSRPSSASACT